MGPARGALQLQGCFRSLDNPYGNIFLFYLRAGPPPNPEYWYYMIQALIMYVQWLLYSLPAKDCSNFISFSPPVPLFYSFRSSYRLKSLGQGFFFFGVIHSGQSVRRTMPVTITLRVLMGPDPSSLQYTNSRNPYQMVPILQDPRSWSRQALLRKRCYR